MRKFLLIICTSLLMANLLKAQTKFGDNKTVINPNSLVEMESTNKGLLLPRIALTSTTAAAPLTAHVAGMYVYNTATAGTAPTDVTPGMYYNDGNRWIKLVAALPDQTVDVNGMAANLPSPNSFAGGSFSPNTPADPNNVYVNTADGTLWTYNTATSQYRAYQAPNSTEWYLYGTTTDAGANKTGIVYRTGSTAVGTGNIITAPTGSMAVGTTNTAGSANTMAIGLNNLIGPAAGNSLVVGQLDSVYGQWNLVGGYGNRINGQINLVGGSTQKVTGNNNLVSGAVNTVSGGSYMTAIGTSNTVTNTGAQAFGRLNTVSGQYAFAMGLSNQAINNNSMAIGSNATTTVDNQMVLGFANGVVLPKAATPPVSPVPGTAYYNTATNKLMVWDGTVWQAAW